MLLMSTKTNFNYQIFSLIRYQYHEKKRASYLEQYPMDIDELGIFHLPSPLHHDCRQQQMVDGSEGLQKTRTYSITTNI